MLIKCPECDLQVSDKATSCPHCGYPLKSSNPQRRRTSAKRMRLPNGFGQISEIKGRNLRKPFRAMISVGKDHNGRPICKPLQPEAYFETYNDAYAALVEYNKNPYELESTTTVEELYARWLPEYLDSLKERESGRGILNAWRYCSAVRKLRIADIRPRHIKACMESELVINGEPRTPSPAIQDTIKTLFNLLLDYAVECDLVDKNYARAYKPKSKYKVENGHSAYTDEEMDLLWEASDTSDIAALIVIQCYSGWRPKELCMLELQNINLVEDTFTGGIKTEAGTNRTVPIHSRIKPLVERLYEDARLRGEEYLFTYPSRKGAGTGADSRYHHFFWMYKNLRDRLKLDPNHRPHDGRVQFVTMAKRNDVNEYAIKYIVGHSIRDLTEKVYTKRDPKWLKTEIEKIK